VIIQAGANRVPINRFLFSIESRGDGGPVWFHQPVHDKRPCGLTGRTRNILSNIYDDVNEVIRANMQLLGYSQ
jgi:hypothetical protein